MKRKILSLIICLSLVLSAVPFVSITASAAGTRTREEAVEWAKAQVNKPFDFDGSYGIQCVDLIKAYYQYLGASPVTGNASAYASNSLPSGWTRIANSKGWVPDPGDIAVWTKSSNGGSAGHVAIVLSATLSNMTVAEFWGSNHTAHISTVSYSGYSNSFYGVIRPVFKSSQTGGSGHDPIGNIDSYSGGEGKVSIGGWAFDEDNKSQSIEIHVYLDGVGIAFLTTDVDRSDVNKAYNISGKHGFARSIPVYLSGQRRLQVYAINISGGANKLLLDKVVDIKAVITEARIDDVDSNGYMLYLKERGATSVKSASWTVNKGTDDIKRENMVQTDTNVWKLYISFADHNNDKTSIYASDMYITDASGRETGVQVKYDPARPLKPVISNIQISDVDATGYTVSCDVSCNVSESEKTVRFPTWTASKGQDDLLGNWETSDKAVGTLSGNTATFRVKTSEHNNETGLYITHIYAYDEFGQHASIESGNYVMIGQPTPKATVELNNHLYEVYDYGTYSWNNAKIFSEKSGGHLATVTSASENDAVSTLVSKVNKQCWLGATDEKTEGTWEWITGETFNYAPWRTGEPNNSGNQDYLVILTDKSWNDYASGSNDGYHSDEDTAIIVEYEPKTITFDLNGGTMSESTTKPMTYKSTFGTLPTPKKDGSSFLGWFTAKSGGTQILSTDTVLKDQTVYAQWETTSFRLDLSGYVNGVAGENFDGVATCDVYINGEKMATGVSDFVQNVNPGSSYEIKNIVTASGYKYLGVKTGSISGTVSTDVNIALEFVSTYNIIFDANGGIDAPATQIKVNGQELMLPSSTPTRAGYNFIGWSLKRDEAPIYYAGDSFKTDENTTLYAFWMMKFGHIRATENITAEDALLTLQASIKKIVLTPDQIYAADVDGDGNVTSTDSLLVLQYSIKKISKFPVEK